MKISFADKIIRQIRQKHPQNYMNQVIGNEHIVENKTIDSKDIPFEFMLNTLRLIDGFPTSLFVERTGLGLSAILPTLEIGIARGFIHPLRNGRIIPTKLGQDFQNELLMLFLGDKK